jgi:hypothetical protein
MSETEDEHQVGYRKPPKHSRFAKGVSGNPGGRRKPVATSANSALAKVLSRRVTVAADKGSERMSLLEALMQDIVKKARDGNTRCMSLVLNQLHALEANESAKDELESLCEKAAREEMRRARGESEETPPENGSEN